MLSFFPLDVLDEIWDVIESVSEGFLIYSKGFPATEICCVGWLFGFNGPLRQYFSLYRAVSQ